MNLVDEKCYLICFICASFIRREVEHLFCALPLFVYPFHSVSHSALFCPIDPAPAFSWSLLTRGEKDGDRGWYWVEQG